MNNNIFYVCIYSFIFYFMFVLAYCSYDNGYIFFVFNHINSTNADGFLLIGSAGVTPQPAITIPENIMQEGSDAIVLYRASPEDIPRGSNLSLENIQDAVVYGSSLVADNSLMTSLAPGQLQVMMAGPGSAASRCLSNRPVSMSAFISTLPTPGLCSE